MPEPPLSLSRARCSPPRPWSSPTIRLAGQIGSANGQATPDTLNKYLSNCGTGCDGFLTNSASGQQVVNLWRLSGFSGGLTDIAVEPSDSGSIQTLVAAGTPVLVLLSLAANGLPVGGSTVVVTGVNSDGSLIVNDPNPVLARSNMNDYLYGFQVGNTTWRGTIVSAAAIIVQKPLGSSFILASVSQPAAGGGVSLDVESASGPCGLAPGDPGRSHYRLHQFSNLAFFAVYILQRGEFRLSGQHQRPSRLWGFH